MAEHVFALLVHQQPELFDSLRSSLTDLSVETFSVATCHEAKNLIAQCKPQIIFTAGVVADGSYLSIMNMAEMASVPLNVIVVAAQPDMRSYLAVMGRGAFDFIAPPFERERLNFVIKSAALNTQRRRQAMVLASVAQ